MLYVAAVVERAMKVQEVICRALAGKLSWIEGAAILGIHPRSLRRWRARYRPDDIFTLFDHRRQPSHRKVAVGELERVLRLYRERYAGFNVRHFHHLARREHGLQLSYSWVKVALQEAGLVPKRRARGRHRRRREPRACFGELLHLDGSTHPWLALCPDARQTLIAVLDDATKRLLYAQLWPAETTAAVMVALQEVVRTFGLPMALYTDRARWAFHTPQARGPIAREHPTQIGRALARLGIDHIGAYSPQARGRGERLNRTLQDRLVNELRVAGATTVAVANAYLRERFIPDYNATFARAPADPASAFVPLGDVDLEQIFCEEDERIVAQDNTVTFAGLRLQLDKQRGRPTCAGLRVTVRRHLDASFSVWRGAQRFGRFSADGRVIAGGAPRAFRAGVRPSRGPRPAARVLGRRRIGPRLPVGPGL